MSILTTLGEITPFDQGQQVIIKSARAVIIGTLDSFEVIQEWVDVTEMRTPFDEQPKRIPGMKYVRVAVGEWEADSLPLSTPVEVDRNAPSAE